MSKTTVLINLESETDDKTGELTAVEGTLRLEGKVSDIAALIGATILQQEDPKLEEIFLDIAKGIIKTRNKKG